MAQTIDDFRTLDSATRKVFTAAGDVTRCYNAMIGYEDVVPEKLRTTIEALGQALEDYVTAPAERYDTTAFDGGRLD